jgi:GNAT superfamily N-acetyltransferase
VQKGASRLGIEIREESIESLAEYAELSIAFRVEKTLEVSTEGSGLGGIALHEQLLEPAYVKDSDEREHPTHWSQRFNLANWGLLAARDDGARVGGAVIAIKTDKLYMLDGRSDLAVLWDLRVRPESRGTGVGSLLFQATEEWARDRGCIQLKIETQNNNVRACHFYARMGCTLGGIDRYKYREYPGETQLVWFKKL